MRALTLFVLFLTAGPVFAVTHFCEVEKSLLRHNPETDIIEERKAKTSIFPVTEEEHEDEKTLSLLEAGGSSWGVVTVATGSYLKDQEPWFRVYAQVTDSDQKITGRVLLRMAKASSKAMASTFVFDPTEKFAPTLTLTCWSQNS